ncbi:MAG: phosphopantetheine adenylyltransferase [Candidatus Pacebacteria bacterium]|nr:phosphopantetheine adenylyltransferase [Candidatus Paceibacterota bacterium]
MISKKVVIGGTFDLFHKGHEALLEKAFSLGNVTIGLVSDKMAKITKKRKIESFSVRKNKILRFIKKELKLKTRILKINDKFGPTLKEDFDYIVVSPETYGTALMINREREKINKKLIEIVKIDFVLAEDGKPISSTRIFNGEINRQGKLQKK